ncbi:MAG: hypothetical protein BAA04_13395 [Firmicutes bacterium ZCTH02-B6]|nr:MAG: hypothetical protein BAA04_13395 [Firmicutes bacterium ZCTH02-B6]
MAHRTAIGGAGVFLWAGCRWLPALLRIMLIAAGAMGMFGPSVSAAEAAVRYTVSIGPDPGSPVDIEVYIPAVPAPLELYFPATGANARVESLTARTIDGTDLAVRRLDSGYVHVETRGAADVLVAYRLNLSPSVWSPSTWPGGDVSSVRSEDAVWLVGRDVLVELAGDEERAKEIRLHLPAGWRAVMGGRGTVDSDQAVTLAAGEEAVFLLGQLNITRYPLPAGQLTLIVSNDPPWEPAQLAWSVQAMLESLDNKGVVGPPSDLTLAVLRYPGALRLNPLIVSQTAGDHTIVHWVGTGTLTWWRKHAARDMVGWFVDRTLRLAPDARWFKAGLADYGGLALLFDTGFLTVDDMFQSLRALHSNGLHYAGPAWPSLVASALETPPSHAAQRVLSFQSPLVALLLDVELREASRGSFTIFDLWARLAAEQRQGTAATLHTAAVLAPSAEAGLGPGFAQAFIYGNRLPPADFERLFERWFDQQAYP